MRKTNLNRRQRNAISVIKSRRRKEKRAIIEQAIEDAVSKVLGAPLNDFLTALGIPPSGKLMPAFHLSLF